MLGSVTAMEEEYDEIFEQITVEISQERGSNSKMF